MTKRLLERQTRLLEYLTSGAILSGDHGAPLAAELQGIDRGRLQLEARFSHEKRVEKIASVFPRTFGFLGADRDLLLRRFAETCPPATIGRLENARQFGEFLAAHGRSPSAWPPFLADLAACELACAQARARADGVSAGGARSDGGSPRYVRRNPGVVLHRASFDVRALFEGEGRAARVTARDMSLAISYRNGAPRIVELAAEIFELIAALDDWAAADAWPDADGLIADLAAAGLIELRP